MERADAVIIGAGIIGAATAFELAKAGVRTVSIDKNPAAGYGPTAASCAIVRVYYSTLAGMAFAYEGYFYWRDWRDYLEVDDERGLAEFRETGCLVMQTPQNDHLAKHIAHGRELGIPFEVWDAARIKEALPFYDLGAFGPPKPLSDEGFGRAGDEPVKGGVFWPTGGYVTDPQLAAHNLQRAAEAKGSRFLFGRRVVEILKSAHRVAGVRLDDGSAIEAPIVVNVAGPHSAKVNAMAGALDDMTITTRALKQEVVHVPAPAGSRYYERAPVTSDSDIGVYARPEHGDHILIGSEDPPCDPREWVDPDDYDQSFTEQSRLQLYRYAQRVPTLGLPDRTAGVVELYDVTEDWIPIYDKSCVPGFYMAVGSSGNQFKNAAVAGKMMAALIDYCEGGNDHDAAPLTFRLTRIGRDIDVGFYSRRRTVNRESSFSVLG